MRRVIALLAGLALLVASARTSALHVHAYADHDHPEHHHGPAEHEHHHGLRHANDSPPPEHSARLERCDPSLHTITLHVVCAEPTSSHVLDAGDVTAVVMTPGAGEAERHDLLDVRVHGPPALTQSPPRAPPFSIPL